MGLYLDPPGESKENWLNRVGTLPAAGPAFENVPAGMVLVCLVDSGRFTAAAVAYSADELAVLRSDSRRRKQWFLVPKERLIEACRPDDLKYFGLA